MSAQQFFRLRNPALMMALAAVFPVCSYAASAANVDFAVGNVTAVNVVGVQRLLTKGAEISNGDTIRTGDGGRAQVRFSDGGMISLQPETEFRIDNYQYSGKADGEEKGFFSLLKGGLRTITGYVGRVNRSNYKVTTAVATIGIRGTEYTAVLGDGVLHVNTGEGLIEVCNAAGCMLLASGESGIVSGGRAPSRTDSRPQLSPAAPSGVSVPVYSKSGDVSSTGMVVPPSPVPPSPVPVPLVSGTGYAVAWAGTKGGSPQINFEILNIDATFDSASTLTAFSGPSTLPYAAGVVKGSFSKDGVIGWGVWSSGTYDSSIALADFHYVVGKPTSSADFGALGTLTATYALAGYTLPTSSSGVVGSAPTGTLTAHFGGSPTVDVSLNIPINGGNIPLSVSSMSVSTSTGSFFDTTSSTVFGFIAGPNASHAGMTYKVDGTPAGLTGEAVSGAAVFKR